MSGLAPPPTTTPATPPATPEFKLTMFVPIVVLMGWSKLVEKYELDTSEGSDLLMALRCTYYSVATICLLTIYYIRTRVQATPNEEKIKINTPATMGVEAKSEEMTIQEHDLKEVQKALMAMFMPLVMISVMHWKWEFIRPLVMQSIMMPLTLSDNKLFKIYLLGHSAEGKLKRPWVAAASPLAALMGGGATPAPAAEAVIDKKGKKKGGKKGKSKRPSGDTGVTEKTAAEAKDTKKDTKKDK